MNNDNGLRKRRKSSIATAIQDTNFLNTLKNFDAYAKPLEDFRVRTASGAAVTLISACIILFLIASEFIDWTIVHMKPSLVVDLGRREKMQINLNVTFPHLPCYLLTIDVMDVAGDHQNDVAHSIFKTRIDATGSIVHKEKTQIGDAGLNSTISKALAAPVCGDCYGATRPPSGCCNTCEDVRKAYEDSHWSLSNIQDVEQCVREGLVGDLKEQESEGCNMHGHVEVNKVAGNFHFAPGKSFQQSNLHIHDLVQYSQHPKFDFSHTIHEMSFGKQIGFSNPLDSVSKAATKSLFAIFNLLIDFYMYQYFVKVVGTEFNYMNGSRVGTNQFSVTESERDLSPQLGGTGAIGISGVFFNYEISPMLVVYTEYQKAFAHFLTDVCAIVGGIFTVAGMLDGAIFSAGKRLMKRRRTLTPHETTPIFTTT